MASFSFVAVDVKHPVYYVEPRTVLFMRSKLSIAHFLAFSILYARYEAQFCIGSGPFIEIAMKKREIEKLQ